MFSFDTWMNKPHPRMQTRWPAPVQWWWGCTPALCILPSLRTPEESKTQSSGLDSVYIDYGLLNSEIFKANIFKIESVRGLNISTQCARLDPLCTHLYLLDQCQRVIPHLDGSWQLAGDRHSQHHAIGGCGEDTPQDDTSTERVRHNGSHNDQDGGKEVRSAVKVTQRTDLPCQRNFIPEERGGRERRREFFFNNCYLK